MDWLNILDQIFDVCLIPLLGLATTVFKTENGRE